MRPISDRLEYVIVGVGVNVNWFPKRLPPGAQPATSLRKETGHRVSRVKVLATFLNRAEALYRQAAQQGYRFLRREWEKYSLVQDQPVKIETGRESWSGVARGIDEQGALIVRLDDGQEKRFHTGDVHLRI